MESQDSKGDQFVKKLKNTVMSSTWSLYCTVYQQERLLPLCAHIVYSAILTSILS